MFKTSAKFPVRPARVLQAQRLISGLERAPDNDNRRQRKPLLCRWALAEGGTRLACHWEEATDAPGPTPAHQPRPAPASDKRAHVNELSYSQAPQSQASSIRRPRLAARI